MRTKLLTATALAGSLAMASFFSAHATPAPSAAQASGSGLVTLVAQPGGGGGGPGGGGPRGHAMNEGGGGREFSREGPRGRMDHGDRGRFAEGDTDHRHFAERGHDHDHDFDHGGRHRVFRNGVWVWVYGPDYSYNDCGWLRVRALDTGSPYWWNRYHYCIGY